MNKAYKLPTADGYPDREAAFKGSSYRPSYYVAAEVKKVTDSGLEELDPQQRPSFPKGKTGIVGRGLLYAWGENQTVDAIVCCVVNNKEYLLIGQKPGQRQVFPGGFVEPNGSSLNHQAAREVAEETGLRLEASMLRRIGQVIIDDARTTDNAWVKTTVFAARLTLPRLPAIKGNDDLIAADWLPSSRVESCLSLTHRPLLTMYESSRSTE